MADQDLIKVARGVVEAFNRSDWEACTAALTPDSVYDEVGTSRRLQGPPQIIQALQGLERGDARCQGDSDERSWNWEHGRS